MWNHAGIDHKIVVLVIAAIRELEANIEVEKDKITKQYLCWRRFDQKDFEKFRASLILQERFGRNKETQFNITHLSLYINGLYQKYHIFSA